MIKRISGNLTARDLSVGDIVTANPWKSGERQAPRRGIVIEVNEEKNPTDSMIVVWFYTLGTPDSGTTAQSYRPRELDKTGESYLGASVAQLRRWERGCADARNATGTTRYNHLGYAVNRLRVRLQHAERVSA